MTRFFADPSDISGGFVRLSAENTQHIRVLRLRPDELFVVCDGSGTDYICRVGKRGDSLAVITETRPSQGEPDVCCTVYLALAKGDRLETAVQKSVELGARAIVLFPSERCVATPGDIPKKTARLQRIALEAAKQSGRGIIPCVTAADSFSSAVTQAACAELPLFFYERQRDLSLRQALESGGGARNISVFTGPEGGFAPLEAEHAAAAGLRSVSLGPRILRCETAPICALAAIMYQTGNFG